MIIMIKRPLPDTLYYECPECDDYTEHQVLKGRMGRSSIEGTFRCNECGRVTSETVKIPELLEVPVLFSDGDVTETSKTTIESNEIVAENDEFFMDDGRRVCVTHLDTVSGVTSKKALATDIKRLWVKQFDVLSVKVSVNDDRRTYSLRVEAEPDDEFVVGTQLEFEDFNCLIHAIKTRNGLVKRGVAEARDVVRIYGKIRKKTYQVLDLSDDFDESDYDVDDE